MAGKRFGSVSCSVGTFSNDTRFAVSHDDISFESFGAEDSRYGQAALRDAHREIDRGMAIPERFDRNRIRS